ncbi:P-loop containing nucleoside triphosphate hydrolase protein [Trichoderma sp. SZMC 28015]
MADSSSIYSNDESSRQVELPSESISSSFSNGDISSSVTQVVSESDPSTPGNDSSVATTVELGKDELEVVGDAIFAGTTVPEYQKESLAAANEIPQSYSEAIFSTEEVPENLVDDLTEQTSQKLISEEEALEKTTLENGLIENVAAKNETVENGTVKNAKAKNETLENEMVDNKTLENETLENKTLENAAPENERLEGDSLERKISEDEAPRNEPSEEEKCEEEKYEEEKCEEEKCEEEKCEEEKCEEEKCEEEKCEEEKCEEEKCEEEKCEEEESREEESREEESGGEKCEEEESREEESREEESGGEKSGGEKSEGEKSEEKEPEEEDSEEESDEEESEEESEEEESEEEDSEEDESEEDESEEEESESRSNTAKAVESAEIDASETFQKVINPFGEQCSEAAKEWQERKQNFGEESDALDKLMTYKGLERVKQQFLDMKSKYQIRKKQSSSGWRKRERLNIIFQGNPGTGKTTIARLYAKFLKEIGLIKGEKCVELSGIQAATKGADWIMKKLKFIASEGGVLFIDEAYQLVAGYVDGAGRQVLDLILTEMENKKGKLAVILVGYKEQLEPLFQHNPGLQSRIPYIMDFDDFDNSQLWQILVDKFKEVYRNNMQIEGGEDGLNVRIAIRRLAQARGSRSFGNARAVENMMSTIADRQARRLIQEKKSGNCKLDYHTFTQRDLIGPEPSSAARTSTAYAELQKMVGLEEVKESIDQLIGFISINYHQRELQDKSPIAIPHNQVFVGAPGTGKTTVAGLYGRILADLGYLSRGDVVYKTAADFIGDSLGKSEANTKRILNATIGKVLVIDEAYMLDVGESGKDQDKFKTAVIDTMVSMIQGTLGEDRCVILIGYEDKMNDLFRNSNPGLSRRFPIQQPLRFHNFTAAQLEEILRLKIEQSELEVTEEAIGAARDIFTTALMRPNFTNGGEVDSMLAIAKKNYAKRLYRASTDKIIPNLALEAADFDPEFDRGNKPEPGFHKMLAGQVDDTVINQLTQYFHAYSGAKKIGLNPRDVVATNFVFKGGPGSGKTTTAKLMGNVFYNMGYLSTSEVIECSAADLIGQYVGQTAPKARKKLQEGLGHVLLIDEIHRLVYSGFSIEAIDELVNFVSKNAGKVVVIIAGFTAEVSQLLSFYPDLAGHFSEVIIFPIIKATDCIKLLASELAKFNIGSVNNFLDNPRLDQYQKIRRLFHALSVMPFWNNARDVKSLAKQIVRQYLGNTRSQAPKKSLGFEFVAQCLKDQILQRKQRIKMPKGEPSIAKNMQAPLQQQQHQEQQVAPPPPPVQTIVQQDQGIPKENTIDTQGQEEGSQKKTLSDVIPIAIAFIEPQELSAGGSGAGNEVAEPEAQDSRIAELHHASASAEAQPEPQEAKRKRLRKKNRRLKKMEQLKSALASVEKELAKGDDKQSSWKAKQDDLKSQISSIDKKVERERKIADAIGKMSQCCAGYEWYPVEGGYKCKAGVCFISEDKVRAKMGE